ncbi:MAG TPA: hypothetical protein VD907_02050 [Verrucomicrobiae bacterium]|nr:hypothetical protein [Verrucomicrobiae bacterium]
MQDCSATQTQKELITTATIPPQQTTVLDVGIFESTMPEPELCLECSSNSVQPLRISLLKSNRLGEYSLQYEVTNRSNRGVRVSIWEVLNSRATQTRAYIEN